MKNFGYVLATKMLVDGKRKVRFMYRETPDNNQDSTRPWWIQNIRRTQGGIRCLGGHVH